MTATVKTCETKLGKIESAYFGLGGYQDAQLGVWVTLTCGSSGVGAGMGEWSPSQIKCNPRYCKWTEEDRDKGLLKAVRYLDSLLADAKVRRVDELKGKPVEIVLDGMMLVSWRILTEVL